MYAVYQELWLHIYCPLCSSLVQPWARITPVVMVWLPHFTDEKTEDYIRHVQFIDWEPVSPSHLTFGVAFRTKGSVFSPKCDCNKTPQVARSNVDSSVFAAGQVREQTYSRPWCWARGEWPGLAVVSVCSWFCFVSWECKWPVSLSYQWQGKGWRSESPFPCH